MVDSFLDDLDDHLYKIHSPEVINQNTEEYPVFADTINTEENNLNDDVDTLIDIEALDFDKKIGSHLNNNVEVKILNVAKNSWDGNNIQPVFGSMSVPSESNRASEKKLIDKLKILISFLIFIHISLYIFVTYFFNSKIPTFLYNYIGLTFVVLKSTLEIKRSSTLIHGIRAHHQGIDVVYSNLNYGGSSLACESIGWELVKRLKIRRRSLNCFFFKTSKCMEVKVIFKRNVICNKYVINLNVNESEIDEFEGFKRCARYWNKGN